MIKETEIVFVEHPETKRLLYKLWMDYVQRLYQELEEQADEFYSKNRGLTTNMIIERLKNQLVRITNIQSNIELTELEKKPSLREPLCIVFGLMEILNARTEIYTWADWLESLKPEDSGDQDDSRANGKTTLTTKAD